MYRLKSIKLYFFSILKLFFLSFRNIYLKTNFYNKKLINFVPDRISYNPSTYLSSSLINITSDFYKITNTKPELLWENDLKNKQDFENLHSFLWLNKLDRKNNNAGILPRLRFYPTTITSETPSLPRRHCIYYTP